MTVKKLNIYPFVKEPRDFEEIKGSRPHKMLELLEEKGSYKKLNKEEKEELNSLFNELWNSEAYTHGVYKLLGWKFNFDQYLNNYLVKFKYYGWKEIKAFNKTCIRKNAAFPSHVLEIIEKP